MQTSQATMRVNKQWMQTVAWNNYLRIILLAKKRRTLIDADEDKNSVLEKPMKT